MKAKKETLKVLQKEYDSIENVFPICVETEEELLALVEMAAWKLQLYKKIQELKSYELS